MITRIGQGKTRIEDYETYTEFKKNSAILDYKKTDGFIKLILLRNTNENTGH